MSRKIKQIAVDSQVDMDYEYQDIFALCEDETIWVITNWSKENSDWKQLPNLPESGEDDDDDWNTK